MNRLIRIRHLSVFMEAGFAAIDKAIHI